MFNYSTSLPKLYLFLVNKQCLFLKVAEFLTFSTTRTNTQKTKFALDHLKSTKKQKLKHTQHVFHSRYRTKKSYSLRSYHPQEEPFFYSYLIHLPLAVGRAVEPVESPGLGSSLTGGRGTRLQEPPMCSCGGPHRERATVPPATTHRSPHPSALRRRQDRVSGPFDAMACAPSLQRRPPLRAQRERRNQRYAAGEEKVLWPPWPN